MSTKRIYIAGLDAIRIYNNGTEGTLKAIKVDSISNPYVCTGKVTPIAKNTYHILTDPEFSSMPHTRLIPLGYSRRGIAIHQYQTRDGRDRKRLFIETTTLP